METNYAPRKRHPDCLICGGDGYLETGTCRSCDGAGRAPREPIVSTTRNDDPPEERDDGLCPFCGELACICEPPEFDSPGEKEQAYQDGTYPLERVREMPPTYEGLVAEYLSAKERRESIEGLMLTTRPGSDAGSRLYDALRAAERVEGLLRSAMENTTGAPPQG